MKDKIERLRELTSLLSAANKAYYQEDREILSNLEYDKLYDELLLLEQETGMVLGTSPTVQVGYEALDELPKERHGSPMLSLDKTKDPQTLKSFLGGQKGVLSWKLDGLTIVLTYLEGKLQKAVTRGNGEIGEVITSNARVFKNLPVTIPYKGELVLRGEAVIGYSDFKKINDEIEAVEAKYKNPRNLCSGSVRQLNNEITAKRNVNFFAFGLVRAEGVEFENSRERQLIWLSNQGFDVVEYKAVTGETIEESIEHFSGGIAQNDFPSDGLVLIYDNIAYGESLGATAKFPRDSMAFKWVDEVKETTLLEIEWSPSRTGLINPIAVFEPVDLEGTTVSRASLHNVSILKGLELGVGDTIEVYKANMIIPQVAGNLTRSGESEIPEHCPVCGADTQLKNVNEVQSLYCTNSQCQARKIKSFMLFVSRDAINIEGLSEATLEKFIGKGFIKEFADIFSLSKYKEEIVIMEGFGEKSFENLMNSIERARSTSLYRVIYSLGITGIGLSTAKMICKEFGDDLEKIRSASRERLGEIAGIGSIIADSFVNYFENEENNHNLDHLLKELTINREEKNEEKLIFENLNFVITGNVDHFTNRNELKEFIEKKGGKVTGSVTSKTNYLINNDAASNSSKNKKARELGVEVISEKEFLKLTENV